MRSSRYRPEFARVAVHPLMSVSVGGLGVLTTIAAVTAVAGLPGPGAGLVAVVLIAPVVEAVAGNVLFQERVGVAGRIRELALLLVVVYAGSSVARGGPFGGRFAPALEQMVPVVSSGAAWLLAFLVHNRLRGRESLLRTLAGRHGGELRRAVLDHQREMADTVAGLRQARGLAAAAFFVPVALVVIAAAGIVELTPVGPASAVFVLVAVHAVTVVVVVGLLNAFIEEYAANGEGLAVAARFGRRRTVAAVLLIAVVLGAAFGLSRPTSALPLEAIGAFFLWLSELFRRDGQTEPPPRLPQQTAPTLPSDLLALMEEMAERRPPLWLRLLWELLGRVAIALLVTAVILFVFGPRFSPAFRDGLRRFAAGLSMKRLLQELRRRVAVVGRLLRLFGRRRRRTVTGEAEQEAAATRRGAPGWRPSVRKRRQMDRVVTVFLSVAAWGERRGVPYSRPLAAHEYLSRIAALHPEHYSDAACLAATFCEARFSRHLVPYSEMRRYVEAAKRITRSR